MYGSIKMKVYFEGISPHFGCSASAVAVV